MTKKTKKKKPSRATIYLCVSVCLSVCLSVPIRERRAEGESERPQATAILFLFPLHEPWFCFGRGFDPDFRKMQLMLSSSDDKTFQKRKDHRQPNKPSSLTHSLTQANFFVCLFCLVVAVARKWDWCGWLLLWQHALPQRPISTGSTETLSLMTFPQWFRLACFEFWVLLLLFSCASVLTLSLDCSTL